MHRRTDSEHSAHATGVPLREPLQTGHTGPCITRRVLQRRLSRPSTEHMFREQLNTHWQHIVHRPGQCTQPQVSKPGASNTAACLEVDSTQATLATTLERYAEAGTHLPSGTDSAAALPRASAERLVCRSSAFLACSTVSRLPEPLGAARSTAERRGAGVGRAPRKARTCDSTSRHYAPVLPVTGSARLKVTAATARARMRS